MAGRPLFLLTHKPRTIMRLLIECLPYLSGLLVGLYLVTQATKSLPILRLVVLSVLVGLFVNRLSGEPFQLVVVDSGVVAAVALLTYYARRAVSGY